MLRHSMESLRLFLELFRDVPPMPRKTFLPGVVLIVAYPLLAVLLGPGESGQAFITAFLLALAVRIAVRFETMVLKLKETFGRRETAVTAVLVAMVPLFLLASVADPLWCQRSQSAYYIILGSMFVSDMLSKRNDMAARFWPWPEMEPHLPAMTRIMVLHNLGFLLLNETMIRVVDPSHWLLFWAVLPVLAHVIVSALILTLMHSEDDDPAYH
ncbi:MAG: hypothetical protein WAT09_16705 [Paracoccaceae bacterium]